MPSLMDLNDRLFSALDRLEAAEGDEIGPEIERAKAVSVLAGRVIDNAKTTLEAVRVQVAADDTMADAMAVPRLLTGAGEVSGAEVVE